MRTYWRQRNDLVRAAGQAIIKAIPKGERDPHKLAAFRHPRVKASEEQIAQSLEGNWQQDLLFVLKQLARLVYRSLHYGMKYVDHGATLYEAQHRQLQTKQLKWKASKPGFDIVQAPAT